MRILEAGHYYAAKGPTTWSIVGWEILQRIKATDDKSMLFIDDIHDLADVSPAEVALPQLAFDPKPDFTVMESAVVPKAWEVLAILKTLSRKKAARMHAGKWYCSDSCLVTSSGMPSCVLLDTALTLLKKELGAEEGINILPTFYKEEQRKLLRLVTKTIPDFRLEVVLYDLDGNVSYLENKT